MLKVTIEDRKPEETKAEWEYPCLGKHSYWGGIVLFDKEGQGTVICKGRVEGCSPVGDVRSSLKMADYFPLKNKRIIIEC